MALTLTDLLGTPADGVDLDRNIAVWTKATGVSSKIAPGRVAFLDESTGIGAIATAGSTGQMGIVPKLDPINTDSDDTFLVINGPGAQAYAEAGATIKKNTRCMPTTGGKLIQYVAGNVATPTEASIESAIKDFERAPFKFVGHYGEGSGLYKECTDAVNGDAIRVEHL